MGDTMNRDMIVDLAERCRPIFEKYRVIRAIVFGSIARGEATRHSDLDLLLIQPDEKPFLDRYEGILSEIIQAVPGRDVDLLIYTPQELSQMAQRRWIVNVLKEGKTIYESK
jgi:uncharacterized protein